MRLMPAIGEKLRDHNRRKGDISKVLMQALESVDLVSVPVIQLNFSAGVESTSAVLTLEMKSRIKKIAKNRGCSVNAIVNSALAKYTLSSVEFERLEKKVVS